MKIYIMHYAPLGKRKAHMVAELKRHGIPETDYEFIEGECNVPLENDFSPCLKRSQISLFVKHRDAFAKLANRPDDGSTALFLEDDVVLCPHFQTRLAEYLTELPADFDMLFLGDGCQLHIPLSTRVPGKHIYEKGLYPTSWGGDGATRCTDSYILSRRAAQILCRHYQDQVRGGKPISQPIDFWLNQAARETNLKVYWAEPTLVTQGSQKGLFPSSIL